VAEAPTLTDFKETARLFRALAHPLRLAITCGLARSPVTQGEIVAVLGRPQSTVAQHLAKLRTAWVVAGSREGAQVVFHVTDPAAGAVIEAVCRQRHNNALKEITWQKLGELDWNSI
jgi:DNA-binding transcriptional ArsR family regulator